MFSLEPSAMFKPLFIMAWIGMSIIALVGVLMGDLSLAKAGLISASGAVILVLINTGFFKYLYYININTSFPIQLKGVLISFISSYIYPFTFLLLFFVGTSSRDIFALYLVFVSLMSMLFALILFRRIRLIDDTPSTYLSSAAQGYAELEGVVTLYENEVVRGPNQDLPVMVWYRKYFLTSSAGFILEDSKGRCTINPRDAEVITPLYHYIGILYRAIYPNETVYVLGYLETLSKQRTEEERKSLVRQKLVGWKRNQFKFLNYFDKNNDRKIDEIEMKTAKNAAERNINEVLEEVYLEPATHTISAPEDGRPFLLSSIHPDELVIKYKRAMIFHFLAWAIFGFFSLIL